MNNTKYYNSGFNNNKNNMINSYKSAEPVEKVSIQQDSKKFNVFIEQFAQKKIDYLCSKIPTREWSGILLYEISGNPSDIENVIVTVKDLIPMDIGSASATSYSYNEKYSDYLLENPEAMNYRKGHIHSHNTMSTFLSGTDTNELAEGCLVYSPYFSLVVNNTGPYTAALTTLFESNTKYDQIVEYKDFDGNVITKSIPKEDTIKFAIYNLANINSVVLVDESFVKSVDSLLKENKTVNFYNNHTNNYNDFYNNPYKNNNTLNTGKEVKTETQLSLPLNNNNSSKEIKKLEKICDLSFMRPYDSVENNVKLLLYRIIADDFYTKYVNLDSISITTLIKNAEANIEVRMEKAENILTLMMNRFIDYLTYGEQVDTYQEYQIKSECIFETLDKSIDIIKDNYNNSVIMVYIKNILSSMLDDIMCYGDENTDVSTELND